MFDAWVDGGVTRKGDATTVPLLHRVDVDAFTLDAEHHKPELEFIEEGGKARKRNRARGKAAARTRAGKRQKPHR